MSRFRRFEIIDAYSTPFFSRETSIIVPKPYAFPSFLEEEHDLSFPFDFITSVPNSDPFEIFDDVTDLIEIKKSPSCTSYKRIIQRVKQPELPLQRLCDRVSALESRFERLVNVPRKICGDRTYTWTAEIKGPVERKYKWTAEIKDGKKKKEEEEEAVVVVKKGGATAKNYKWTAEIKGEREVGGISRKYKFHASSGNADDDSREFEKKGKKKEKKKKVGKETRVVEIEEDGDDYGAFVLRQAFGRRGGAIRNNKGKNKELSPQDAALMIQMEFRAYLIRRSQALRALRELAVAKTKLKELRSLFNNFSYRRHIARDAVEQQKFSEKIIVLLLTVDAIEGSDVMVRAAKRSMVDELEAMLDVVDPQPKEGKSLSMRRRTFDMPDSLIQNEIAEGVSQVVQMLENEEKLGDTFEACL